MKAHIMPREVFAPYDWSGVPGTLHWYWLVWANGTTEYVAVTGYALVDGFHRFTVESPNPPGWGKETRPVLTAAKDDLRVVREVEPYRLTFWAWLRRPVRISF